MNQYVGENEFPECFPDNFRSEILPDGAKPREWEIYHICLDGIIHRESFLSSFEDGLLGKRPTEQDDPNNPSTYSTSCFIKPKDVRDIFKSLRNHHRNLIIAQGKTSIDSGLVQLTSERTGCKKSHIDWWIYKNKDVSIAFTDKTSELIKGGIRK